MLGSRVEVEVEGLRRKIGFGGMWVVCGGLSLGLPSQGATKELVETGIVRLSLSGKMRQDNKSEMFQGLRLQTGSGGETWNHPDH